MVKIVQSKGESLNTGVEYWQSIDNYLSQGKYYIMPHYNISNKTDDFK